MRRLLGLLLLAGCAHDNPLPEVPAPLGPDPRLKVRKVSDGNDFKPYTDRAAWEARVKYLREKQLVACGLWPLPERCPLNPVITKTIDRGDYTIENLYFASYRGFYVTGSLYRPKGPGPFPAVLEPHGHSKNGRQEDRGEKTADRYPYQARCIGLAKLGCIAFFHDMVGYADSKQVRHPTDSPKKRVPEGTDDFEGLEFELRLLSTMGLQTWNSIRALDYLVSRPDVDPKRIACTGGSGGATQTLMLMMTDERLAAAAPVCMVSPGFQGDCTCEQAALGKIGTDTVEFAAAFAPKPLLVVGATGDWTKEILEKGGPEIRATYALMGAPDRVSVVRFEAPHNYNRTSREAVLGWFNRWLKLGHAEPVKEPPIDPIDPRELAVFDAQHPPPEDALDATGLKNRLIESHPPRMTPAERRTALRHLVASDLPESRDVIETRLDESGSEIHLALARRNGSSVEAKLYRPGTPSGAGAVLVSASPGFVDSLLARGVTVLDVRPYPSRSQPAPPLPSSHAFFACFNRTLLAERVHDLLTAVAYLRGLEGIRSVDLAGYGSQGATVCLLARGLCGDRVRRTLVEHARSGFRSVLSADDDAYLPGALRYGDLGGLAALAAPGELFIADPERGFDTTLLRAAYRNSEALIIHLEPEPRDALVRWMTRP